MYRRFEMNDKALKVLEFDKIRQRLEGFMECGLGKERAMELKPYSQIEKVKELLQETDEAKRLWIWTRTFRSEGYRT